MCVYIYIYIYTYVCMYKYTYTCMPNTHVYICVYIHIYIHIYISLHIYVYIYIYMYRDVYTYIYVYIHTYICIYLPPSRRRRGAYGRAPICPGTPGLHNKIPAHKIFARVWVDQESIVLHYIQYLMIICNNSNMRYCSNDII